MEKKDKVILGVKIAMAVILVAGVSIASAYYFWVKRGNLTPEQIKTKTEKFISEELVNPGTQFEITDVKKINSVYQMTVKFGGQEISSYATLDGKLFFPQGIAIPAETPKTAGENGIPQSDKPEVKLFVMSFCPYGTQMEKALLPVLETLKGKIDFSLEFVDYAMHGKKEIDENLRQYCIQKYEPEKLSGYLNCFLKKGEGTSQTCMKEAGVNQYQVTGCVAKTDQDFKITVGFNDKSTWNNGQYPSFGVNKSDDDKYGVEGSPTLVINDQKVDNAPRTAQELLDTVCGAFNNKPSECEAKLSSDTPTPGFGTAIQNSASATSGGSCAN